MTKLSTKINNLLNETISKRTLTNLQAQRELSKEATHKIIQLIRNELQKPCFKHPQAVEACRKVIV